jgi:MFS family permease
VFFLGIGSTWTLTTAVAHFANAPRARRGAAMSVFAGALLAGQSIGPAVGGGLASASDWRVAMGVGGGIAVLIALSFLRFRGEAVGTTKGGRAGTVGDDRATPLVLAVIYLLPAIQFSVGAAVVQTIIPIVADSDLGLGPGIVGLALGVGGVVRFVGAIASGQISDRIGRRWALLPGLALQVGGLALLTVVGTVWSVWLTIGLLSLGSVTVNVGNTVLADLSEGGRLGRRLGAFRFTGDAAFLVAPLGAGLLLESGGRPAAMLPFLLFTVAVTIASIVVIPETLSLDAA